MLVSLLNQNGAFTIMKGSETLEFIGVLSVVAAQTYCAMRGYMVDKILG